MRSIWRYTFEQWGEPQADSYTAAIRTAALNFGATFDRLGLRAFYRNYHRVTSGQHFIFLLIENDRLTVVRILHRAMDIDRHLPPA